MRSLAPRRGLVLVTLLLSSAVIWTVLAGLLLLVRLQYEVALVARDQRVAREAATWLVESVRAHDWWGGSPLPASSGAGEGGMCTWMLEALDVSLDHAWYAAEVTFGRTTVRLDATARRPP